MDNEEYKVNYQLQIDCWDALDFLIKDNQSKSKEFESKKGSMTSEEKKEFIDRAKNNADIYHAMKPLFLEYRKNPSKELEDALVKNFGMIIQSIIDIKKTLEEKASKEPVESKPEEKPSETSEKKPETESTTPKDVSDEEVKKEFDAIPEVKRVINYETGEIIDKPESPIFPKGTEAPKPVEPSAPVTPKSDLVEEEELDEFEKIFGSSPSL